jgi:hypothetical protein
MYAKTAIARNEESTKVANISFISITSHRRIRLYPAPVLRRSLTRAGAPLQEKASARLAVWGTPTVPLTQCRDILSGGRPASPTKYPERAAQRAQPLTPHHNLGLRPRFHPAAVLPGQAENSCLTLGPGLSPFSLGPSFIPAQAVPACSHTDRPRSTLCSLCVASA